MKKIIIDGSNYKSKDKFHNDIKDKFDLPDYYGNNLDSLWDLLTEKRRVHIEFKNPSALKENLGDYGDKIIQLFEDLNKVNDNEISFIEKDKAYTLKEIAAYSPQVHDSVYIAEGARIMGKVKLMENVSVWCNAVIRGDNDGGIIIGKNSNVQDNAVIHLSDKSKVIIGDNVTIGHSAIVHGARIEDNVLIGMGAIILDNAHIKKNSIIGAGALVTGNKVIEEGSMVMGAPARLVRQCRQDEIDSISKNAQTYVRRAEEHRWGK